MGGETKHAVDSTLVCTHGGAKQWNIRVPRSSQITV